MSVAENLRNLRKMVPANIEIVAVSKFHPAELIIQAYEAGQRLFGESRVQEFLEKQKALPPDIKWHFIGHLQTNKVKQIIGKTHLIESVDSERLLELIDRESLKAGIVTNVLLQVHVAAEETKFGFSPEELIDFFHNKKFENLKASHICGLMGMATNTEDSTRIIDDFKKLHSIFEEIRDNKNLNLKGFDHLSMGMSGDWQLAVEQGSNIIRIGSAIFGERNY